MRWLYRAVAVVCAVALLLTGWSLLAGWQTERAASEWHPPTASGAPTGGLLLRSGTKGTAASHLFPLEWQLVPTRGTFSVWAALTVAFAVVAVRQARRRAVPG
jgi:hypothetical protein